MTTTTLLPKTGELLSAMGLQKFPDACAFVHSLPYGRNENPNDPLCVVNDRRGTCSTKHSLLSRLAREMGLKNWQLRLGIIRMDRNTLPEVATVLDGYKLNWLPEAHVFMRQAGDIRDYTFPGRDSSSWESQILWECSITPEQVMKYKRYLHLAWMRQHRDSIGKYPLEALWQIRQECIASLQNAYV